MKQIPLSQGKFALVDDEDYGLVAQYKWCAKSKPDNRWYAARIFTVNGKKQSILLHRFLMNPKPGEQVDHINGNGLDCRKSNLRIATHAQNRHNSRVTKRSRSGLKGVWYTPSRHGWRSAIMANGKRISIGIFKSAYEAAKAYNNAAKRLHGDFAKLNEIN